MLLVGEYSCNPCFHPPILIERLHATHEISKLFISKLLSKLPLIIDPSNVNQSNYSILFKPMQNIRLPDFFFLAIVYMSYFWFAYNITHGISIRAPCTHSKKKSENVIPASKNKLPETFVMAINPLSIISRISCQTFRTYPTKSIYCYLLLFGTTNSTIRCCIKLSLE